MTTSIPTAAVRREERPPFVLAHEPDGRSWTVRENLSDILERELLGPANGKEELLNGSPDSAYLVGRIAPARLTAGRDDPTTADDPEAATDVGDAVDADESRGVPVTAVDDSTASADEDSVEDQPQQRGLMIPASMGLRFQIPTDLDRFTVLATWGTYKSVADERSDSPRARKYQRTPMEFLKAVRVADVVPGTTKTYPLHDEVVLRVDRYDDTDRSCRMFEVALCNDRETPRKIPVDAWLYQTRLTVDAGGAEVFLPVTDALLDTRDERDDELRRLRLQYRDRLEFALGRTCSVDWAVAPTARRATSVWTTWLPTSETPQNTAEYIQASSRVGRDPDRPGLVVSLGNWARPRDLAHFEQFRHYHETFYRQVEALSVTPFSVTSLERGLDGVLVSAARVQHAIVTDGLSPEQSAGRIDDERVAVEALIDALVQRVLLAADEDSASRARQHLTNRLDQWSKRRAYLKNVSKALAYERTPDEAHQGPLMTSPEMARAMATSKDAAPFVVANSMREVQPEINLLVSPITENLVYVAPPGSPTWKMPEED